MAWLAADRIDDRAAGQERRSGDGRRLRDAVRRDDGAQCFSRRPDSRDGGDVASWRRLRKIEASNAIEGGLADRPSMGLAKAGFEAAESRLDDFRFSPDSRWANGWPEMGGGPGEERH